MTQQRSGRVALILREVFSGENSFFRQVLKKRSVFLLCLVAGLLGSVIVIVIADAAGVGLSQLTRDTAAVREGKLYDGLLSNLGIMVWASATALSFFGAVHVSNDDRRKEWFPFLLYTGIFSLILMLDDTFMFHEELFPEYLNVRESIVYGAYIVIAGVYFGTFSLRILRTNYMFLLVSLFFFGISMSMDKLLQYTDTETYLEDSAKFMGIVFWLGYHSQTLSQIIASNTSDKASGAES